VKVRFWMLGALGILVAGCSSEASSGPAGSGGSTSSGIEPVCAPGQQVACACPGTPSEGAQLCKDDGSGFESCQGCAEGSGGAATGSGGSGGTGGASQGSGGQGSGAGGSGGSATVECAVPEDCLGDDGECQARTCIDGMCGMSYDGLGWACSQGVCDGLGACIECLDASQCATGVCDQGYCVDQGCTDNVKNGQETATDCGGPDCAPC